MRKPLAAILFALTAACDSSPADGQHELNREFPKLDTSQSSVDLFEIQSGGVPRDGIPAILEPHFILVGEADDLGREEPVMTLTGECGAHAFPYRVLIWHEIVHHNFCGRPVIVTYCPLCNTSMVFDRRVDGEKLTFGTSGRLRNSDLVMYDHQTESFWQQFTGEAIVGTMTGNQLQAIPAKIESFEKFAARHPDGQVLAPPRYDERDYGRNPYAGYDTLPKPFMFQGPLPEGIEPLERVVRLDDRAWALSHLREKGRIETDDGLVLEWMPGQNSALDSASISRGRDIGNVEVTKDGKDVAFSVDFAFAFHAFYPDSEIVQ